MDTKHHHDKHGQMQRLPDNSHANHRHLHNYASGNIRLAFVLNLAFSFIELIGGIYTNSVAILSDAIHDFGDGISLGVSWYLQKKSQKGRDEFYSYGYKRFSLLGAVIISFVLIISSFLILRESISRLLEPQASDAQGMLLLAILGILVNGFAAFRMKKGESLNERAVTLHLLEDVFGWAAVLIASIVMIFVNVPLLDPLLSIGITFWVLFNVYRNLRDAFKVLLQEVPQNIDTQGLLTALNQLPDVSDIHDFHLWSLDGLKNIMTIHVVTDASTNLQKNLKLKSDIKRMAHSFGIEHVTIEMETIDESNQCKYKDCD